MDSWCKNLELLIKSRTSLIWIRTKEEERLEKLISFSNLSSSLVLIQINEVLDFISNSKFLHQEFIIFDFDYFLLFGSKGNLLSEIVVAEVVITSFLANNCSSRIFCRFSGRDSLLSRKV